MARLEDNLKILELLKDYMIRNPDMRFLQIISNMNAWYTTSELYYEETDVTLERFAKYVNLPFTDIK